MGPNLHSVSWQILIRYFLISTLHISITADISGTLFTLNKAAGSNGYNLPDLVFYLTFGEEFSLHMCKLFTSMMCSNTLFTLYLLASAEVEADDDEDDDDDDDDCKKSMDEVSGLIDYIYSKSEDVPARWFAVWILNRAQQDLKLSLLKKCPL